MIVVATATAPSTGHGRYRVANANVMSWLLSPTSATKITAKLIHSDSKVRETTSGSDTRFLSRGTNIVLSLVAKSALAWQVFGGTQAV
jgi:hypothetical protein